jgi:CDP-4-dehydro-6-deoxyglucose reductase
MIDNDRYRSFSMAGRKGGGELEFLIKKISGGLFTDRMVSKLKTGDQLSVELPFGSFAYHDDDYKPVIFVATGTGIAPIKSMIEMMSESPDCPPVMLYWGVRAEADLFLHGDIELWSKKLEDFTYTPVLSKPSKSWSGRVGYVQDQVAQDFTDLSEHAIYICGSPVMIRDASKVFLKLNAQISHIYTDAFNFQESSMENVVF